MAATYSDAIDVNGGMQMFGTNSVNYWPVVDRMKAIESESGRARFSNDF